MFTYIISCYKSFDTFLRMQSWVGFFYSFTWCLFIPIVHKMQGMLLSITIISIYLVLSRISGLIIPALRGKSLKLWILLLMLSTVLYIIATPIYFYDKNLFLYSEMFLSILSGVLYPALHITWDLHVVKNYDNEIYENYKYFEQFRSSLGGILGYFFIILLEQFLEEPQIIVVFFIMLLFCFFYEILNYKVNYYKKSFCD